MRYRETQVTPDGQHPTAPTTDDFVDLTVVLTLLCGVLLLGGGIHGRQRWLQFWGGATLVACAIYYAWPYVA